MCLWFKEVVWFTLRDLEFSLYSQTAKDARIQYVSIVHPQRSCEQYVPQAKGETTCEVK